LPVARVRKHVGELTLALIKLGQTSHARRRHLRERDMAVLAIERAGHAIAARRARETARGLIKFEIGYRLAFAHHAHALEFGKAPLPIAEHTALRPSVRAERSKPRAKH